MPLLENVSVWLLIGSFCHRELRAIEAKVFGKKVVKRPGSSAFDCDVQVHFHGLQAVLFSCVFCWQKGEKMTKLVTHGLNNLAGGNTGQSRMLEGLLSNFVPQMDRWEITPDS